MGNSFGARSEIEIDGAKHAIFRLEPLASEYEIATLPYSLRVLLENAADLVGRVHRQALHAAGARP